MKRKRINKIVSTLLAVVLLLSTVQGSNLLSVSAEEAATPTVSPGETWHAVWTAQERYAIAELHITESGIYQLSLTDNIDDNVLPEVMIYNITHDEVVQAIDDELLINGDVVYLSAECAYGVMAYKSADYTYKDGDILFSVNRLDVQPLMLTLTDAVEISFGSNGREWISFTSTVAGDYALTFSHAALLRVAVHNTSTGLSELRETRQHDECGNARANDTLVLSLEENTTYFMEIDGFHGSYAGTVTVEKCAKDVQSITFNEDKHLYKNRMVKDTYIEEWYNYCVTYADGTQEILTHAQIEKAGLYAPDIYFLGNITTIYGNDYYSGGTQPLLADYKGEYSIVYVTLETLSSSHGDGEGVPQFLFQRSSCITSFDFVMQDTGVYALYSDDVGAFSSISYMLVDQYYKPVQYNESKGGFPMVGGHGYRLYVEYSSTRDTNLWLQSTNAVLFPDTHPQAWYYDAVTYAVGNGIMTGYASNGRFGTSDSIQRQDFLVMLARLDGVDLSLYEGYHDLFPDVAKDSYYEAAVTWGYVNGIVTGYDSGYFGVGDKITREQLVTFLYRYAQYRYQDVSCAADTEQRLSNTYRDFSRVSGFAKDAAIWALDRGVIKGKNATTIAPQGNAQRCEVAQMMYNVFVNDIF